MSPSICPSLLQRFFTDRLLGQLGASPHTVAAYRDTFRLFLRFATTTLRRAPSALRIEEFDVTFLSTFLEHLESTRENTTRTRNNRSRRCTRSSGTSRSVNRRSVFSVSESWRCLPNATTADR